MLWSQTQKTQNSNPDFRPPCTPQTQKSTSEYNITTNPKINIHHKPTNPYQQNSQPTNPPSEYISPPPSTPLSWEIERWKSHLGLSLSGDEIMRLESLGSSRLHNHWFGLQYRIGDWGFVQRSHTKSATMVSYRIGGPSRWVFFLWRQRRPHWVLNEFFGSEFITEIWESLGQIGVWQSVEMRFWESVGLREILSRVKREREN